MMDVRDDGPVVILVHGTFGGSAEERGRLWWQDGGAFRDWLEARLPGPGAEVQTFHWSGRNSEAERRHSARQLLARLRGLDDQGRAYHLVGHSHGGSVIWLALRDSMRQAGRGPLKGLRSWTTAGTPFLTYGARLADTLFLIPLAAVALVVAGLGRGLQTAYEIRAVLLTPEHLGDLLLLVVVWGVAALVLAFCAYRLAAFAAAWVGSRRERRAELSAYHNYGGPRWLRLCAAEDEAVNGLSRVLTIREPVVPRGGLLKLFGRLADGVFWQQVRAIAYGNDLAGHQPEYAGPVPLAGLPADAAADDGLDRRLVARADASSARVADQIRRMLGDCAYGKLVRPEVPAEAGRDEDDNWTAMLVHCAYFSDLPDGSPDGQTEAQAVAERVAAHVSGCDAGGVGEGPAGPPSGPREPAWRALLRAYSRDTAQSLMAAGLSITVALAAVGIRGAQRRVWELTDAALIGAILRDSDGYLRVCESDAANVEWCGALLDAYIARATRSGTLPSEATGILARVDEGWLDDAYDQINERPRFAALLSASERLASAGLTDRARRFAARAEQLGRTDSSVAGAAGERKVRAWTRLVACAERYRALGLPDRARDLYREIADESLDALKDKIKGTIPFNTMYSAGSLHALVQGLVALRDLAPARVGSTPVELAAILKERARPGPGVGSMVGPGHSFFADLVRLADLLEKQGEAASAAEVSILLERQVARQKAARSRPRARAQGGAGGRGIRTAGPRRALPPDHRDEIQGAAATGRILIARGRPDLVRHRAEMLLHAHGEDEDPNGFGRAQALKLLELVDAEAARDRARSLGRGLRDDPHPFGGTRRPSPIGVTNRLRERIDHVLLLGELGLTGPLAEALTALVQDLDRFGAGELVVSTDRGPTPVQGPSVASNRDMLLGYLLRGLARLSGADGFAGLAERAHLTAVRTDAPYLSAKLRVIAARGAVERGGMARALDMARRLVADREVWKAMAKWQRSDLHRALAVIHVAAREFHVARALSEGCDLGHRLFVYASLLRRYDGDRARPGDPAGGLGSGPSDSASGEEDPAD